MMCRFSLALVAAMALAGCGQAGNAKAAAAADMHPDRLLNCVLGRATNLDPGTQQSIADITYEGGHDFAMFLPAAPIRRGPPPDPSDDPEPVDPRARIVADPDGLAANVPPGFDRVVDLWPQRVEIIKTIEAPVVNLIIVHSIDAKRGTARLDMTMARDAATLDIKRVYQGSCRISNEPA